MTLLIGAALLPALILCIYVYIKDKAEKEPQGLLMKLFFLGVLSCFPAAYAETLFDAGLDYFFSPYAVRGNEGELVFSSDIFLVYNFIKYFIGVALIEEFFKWIILRWKTGKEEEFNSLFDGIIYAVFVSLGFAALENVLYVLQYGFGNAIMRGFLSVPGHMFFGVMMGYHYSMWNIKKEAGIMEKDLMKEGIIPYGKSAFNSSGSMAKSLIVPTLAHGLYDFCCTAGTVWALLLFYGFVIFMYIFCFKTVKKISREDGDEKSHAAKLLRKKYPVLTKGASTDGEPV